MPTVRTYGARQVAARPAAPAYRTNTPSAESYGAGLAETGARIATGLLDQVETARRNQLDQIALLDADTAAGEAFNRLMYDPTTGAMTVKGKDALGLEQRVPEVFDKVGAEISSKLTNERQRISFQRAFQNRRESMASQLSQHAFRETQAWDADRTKAAITLSADAAIANASDLAKVADELDHGRAVITDFGRRNGMSQEAIDRQLLDYRTQVHTGIIDRYLSANLDQAAEAYYDETRDQISGDAQARIEKALDAGSLRGRAQRETDQILAAGGTLTEQREKARAIEDPELRDEVMSRLEHEATVRAAAERAQDETTLRGAYDIVDRTHNVAAIPPTVWAELDGNARSGLRGYARALAAGTPVKTDPVTWTRLMELARTDPDKFVQENLLRYKDKLDDGDYQELERLKLSVSNRDRAGTDKILDDFRTVNQVLGQAFDLNGIATTGEDGKKNATTVARVERIVAERVGLLQRQTGKKATNADVQSIVDDVLSATITMTRPSGFWNGGGLWDTTKTKRVVDTTIGDVPAGDRAQIEAALRAAHRPVTDQAIVDLYVDTQLRQQAR